MSDQPGRYKVCPAPVIAPGINKPIVFFGIGRHIRRDIHPSAHWIIGAGYRTAFANRIRGQHAVHPGDDPYWLKRLPNHYITRLPGRGRQYWFS